MTQVEIEEFENLKEICELDKGGMFFPDIIIAGRYYKLKGKKEEHDKVQEALNTINEIYNLLGMSGWQEEEKYFLRRIREKLQS